MKSQISVTLFGEIQNDAVVKLPGRANPGVVVQGDTLGELRSRAMDVLGLLDDGNQQEAKDELNYLVERLDAMLMTIKLEVEDNA